ncbi:MAG: hypothetical protein FJ087_14340 [Deltaproteobacteria bacterium]|nr:hypothetical protein [Deltaproteobacteria bacterium]
MRRALFVVAGLAAAGLVSGCEKGDGFATWSTGLRVHGTGVVTEVSIAYTQVEGDEAKESNGFQTGGALVMGSTGKLRTEKRTDLVTDWQVVGQTRTENPLVPGKPVFGDVPVAIVEGVEVESGWSDARESIIIEHKGGEHEGETYRQSFIDRATRASTWGFAGDEYVVRFSDLTLLWDPDLVEKWHATRTPLPGLDYLTLADAGVGDFWVHPNGRTLHKVVAREQTPNRMFTGVKVELRETGNYDARNVIETCLHTTEDVDEANTVTDDGWLQPGFDHPELLMPAVRLDPGCSGDFLHHKVGYEWWRSNTLVAEDATYFTIAITDFGWHWYDDASKSRMTAKVAPNNPPPDIRKYVVFTVTERHVVWNADKWEDVNTPWSRQ